MRLVLIALAGALTLGLWLTQAALAAAKWQVDPPHCYLGFAIKHLMVPVQGAFTKFDGDIFFDPDDLAGSRIDVTIDVASLDTRNQQRDGHLMSPDFFDVKRFPTMRFVSHKITAASPGHYLAHGQLTIKDVTKGIDLPFTYLGRMDSPLEQGKEVAGFMASLTLDRLEYHVGDGKFYRMGVLGKEVQVILNFELNRPAR